MSGTVLGIEGTAVDETKVLAWVGMTWGGAVGDGNPVA